MEYMDCSPADGSANRLMRRMQQKSKSISVQAPTAAEEQPKEQSVTSEDSYKRKPGQLFQF